MSNWEERNKAKPSIVLSVKLTDDSFDTNITMPVDATPDQRAEFIKSWFALMDAALKMAKPVQEKKP